MKTKIATIVTLAMISTPVLAQNKSFEHQVFANENIKTIELSQTEMKETQGELVPQIAGAILGGVSGGVGYMLGGGRDPYKFLGQVALNAGVGALNPLRASARSMALLAKATTPARVNIAAANIAREVRNKALITMTGNGGASYVGAKYSGKYF